MVTNCNLQLSFDGGALLPFHMWRYYHAISELDQASLVIVQLVLEPMNILLSKSVPTNQTYSHLLRVSDDRVNANLFSF